MSEDREGTSVISNLQSSLRSAFALSSLLPTATWFLFIFTRRLRAVHTWGLYTCKMKIKVQIFAQLKL